MELAAALGAVRLSSLELVERLVYWHRVRCAEAAEFGSSHATRHAHPEPRDEAEVPTPPRDATAADPPAPGASAPPEAEAEAPQHFD